MKTDYVKLDENNAKAAMERAAEIIRHNGLVAFPTETVYGLGANALSPCAVKKIYEAKGRPSDNPLIIHIGDINQLNDLASDVPENAKIAMQHFFPGSLTVVLKKSKLVPYEVTGGLGTVAIRFPKNSWAQMFLDTVKLPIAAPSANTSGKPSPTRGSHVLYDLDGKIDMILDGGACQTGIESTIVDFSTDIPCILRPGTITASMLSAAGIKLAESPKQNDKPKAPGMKYTHYKPLAKITIVKGEEQAVSEKIRELVVSSEAKTGVLCSQQTCNRYTNTTALIFVAGDLDKPETIAANLYKMLRQFDYDGVEEVYSESFADTYLGEAIMNRLDKAAGDSILEI